MNCLLQAGHASIFNWDSDSLSRLSRSTYGVTPAKVFLLTARWSYRSVCFSQFIVWPMGISSLLSCVNPY